jgi:predicted negative regulator of RcsB-dependent stress response
MGDAGLITTYKTLFQLVQSRAAELKKQGKTVDEATTTISSELQTSYPNAGTRLNGTIRAAYNEAP